MTILELKFILESFFEGFTWAYFEIDMPEWTQPQFYHQN